MSEGLRAKSIVHGARSKKVTVTMPVSSKKFIGFIEFIEFLEFYNTRSNVNPRNFVNSVKCNRYGYRYRLTLPFAYCLLLSSLRSKCF